MMKNTVLTFMQQHNMLEPNKTVLIATSGGPDSMALLHFLMDIKAVYGWRIIALTVDHQLRGEESATDARYVQSVCKQWGIEHETVAVDVGTYALEKKMSTQLAARTLRYDVFQQRMEAYDATYLAMGHHGDDQIETMLMSLMRVTTLHGMLGIPAKRIFGHGYIIRPLLCVTKAEIEQYCDMHQIIPRIDLSNFDPIYRRNFIRQAIVPKLKEKQAQMHRTVQRFTETVQEDEQYLIAEAKKMFQDVCTMEDKSRNIKIDIHRFTQYPVPLQRRCYRLTLDYLYKQLPKNMSHMHEELFLEMLQKDIPNKRIEFPQHVWIEKAYDTLYVYENTGDNVLDDEKILQDTEQTVLLWNHQQITLSYIEEDMPLPIDDLTYVGAMNAIQFPLYIRKRRPGDRMTYKGLNGTKKIKDILIDEKIPRHIRDEQIIVTDAKGEILWLVGLRKNEKQLNIQQDGLFVLTYKEAVHINEEDNYAE